MYIFSVLRHNGCLMSIRPSPRTYFCPSCHWSKTVAPRSDALMPGEFFTACPKCGHGELETRDAPARGSATGWLERLARSLQGKK